MNVGFSDSGGYRDFASFDRETLDFLLIIRVSTLRIKYMDVTYDCSDDLLSISRLGGVKSREGAGRGSTAAATFAAATFAAAAFAAAALAAAALACSAACCGSRTAARARCRRRTISGVRSSSAGTGIGARGGGRSAIGTRSSGTGI